jgi:chromosome segregation ATPase
VADERSRTLALVGELAARDAAIAADLDVVAGVSTRAATVGERARELEALLDQLPDERAALDREEAGVREREVRAQQELAEAQRVLSSLEHKRRSSDDRRAQAERELARARETVADVSGALNRLSARRRQLADDEHGVRAEAEGLSVEAAAVAAAARELPRVSGSGSSEPGRGLRELSDWAERVHAALLVVRSSLDTERERVVREANELGAAVLGEWLGGSSVALVRRRIEEALGG